MRRITFAAAAAAALLALAAAVQTALTRPETDGSPGLLILLVVAFVAVVWLLYRLSSVDADRSVTDAPGAPRGIAPERTPDDLPMSGAFFTRTIETAIQRTENTGDIDEGLAVVRPSLRATLSAVLAEAGYAEDEIDARLERGDWTDEQVAAAVLDPAVPLPTLTLRERLTMWLFPERFVTAFTRAAVEEIRETADETLPTIPGETAPRPVPTAKPTLEQLRRSAGGDLTAAVDPFESAGGGRSAAWTDGRAVHEEMGVVEESERS